MDLTVGLSGSGADRIVDGTAADGGINQALADVGASGGGTVTLLSGIYSVNAPINILDDNVTLTGAGTVEDPSTIRATTAMTGMGTIVAILGDHFAVQGVTVDGHTNDVRINPITTSQSSDGVIQDCRILEGEGHNYGIWLVFSDHIKVINNIVDGTTVAGGQEGIETWSSSDIEISGNTVKNVYSAINLSSIPTPGYGPLAGSNGNVAVFNNIIDNAGYGVSAGVTGPRSFGDIDIHDNTMTNILAFGARVLAYNGMTGAPDSQTATLPDSQSLHDINIINNYIGMSATPWAGYGIGIYLVNATAHPDVVLLSNITASDNVIYDAIRNTLVTDFDHFSLDQNIITGSGTTITGTIYDDTIQGNALDNILISGGGSDTWIGGAGADTFRFAADTLTNHLFGVIHDYDQGNNTSGTFDTAENDCVDLSKLLSASYDQHLGSSLRALEGVSGHAAALQVDADQSADGQNWVTIGRLEGLQIGDDIHVTARNVAAEVSVIGSAPAITTNGDGSYSAFYVDTAHEMTWTTLVANYDSNNHEITSIAANDDGSSSINYFDFNNAFDWSTISNSYNAAGQQLTSAVHNDVGSTVNYYEDPESQQNYKEIVNSYDAQGHQVTGAVTNDDGSTVAYYYDTTNQQAWAQIVNSYDADGSQITSAVTNDDGSSVRYYEDPYNATPNREIVNAYNPLGQQLSQSITYQDGTSQSHYWDADNAYTWSQIIDNYDSSGHLTSQNGINHDGSTWTLTA